MDTPPDTKVRILDAAEKLFAEGGFSGTSLRAITSAADVNLAAVNYHFGSKEALIRDVFARRIDPINAERLAWLGRLESGSEPATLEQVLEAFLAPPLRLSQDPEKGLSLLHVAQIIGHATSRPERSIQDLLMQQFDPIVQRFAAAIGAQLPDLPRSELIWRFMFLVGSMSHTMAMSKDLKRLTHGVCDANDAESLISRIVTYAAAGFRAPAPALGGAKP